MRTERGYDMTNRLPGLGKLSLLDTPHSLSALEKCLLNEYQRGFPLCEQPYAEIARQLEVTETAVLATLASRLSVYSRN